MPSNPHFEAAYAPRRGGTTSASVELMFTILPAGPLELYRRPGTARDGREACGGAAVALWALLHGAATLEAGQVLGENKPTSGFEFGLSAWLLLAQTPLSASGAKKSLG